METIQEIQNLLNNIKYLSEYDSKIVKTRLPENLKSQFLTKKQWLEKGFVPNKDAIVYEMHPTSLNKKTCEYYFIFDIEPVSETLECCATCNYYKKRNCLLDGKFVSVNSKCSEYESKIK